jgi:hypothetical protein
VREANNRNDFGNVRGANSRSDFVLDKEDRNASLKVNI